MCECKNQAFQHCASEKRLFNAINFFLLLQLYFVFELEEKASYHIILYFDLFIKLLFWFLFLLFIYLFIYFVLVPFSICVSFANFPVYDQFPESENQLRKFKDFFSFSILFLAFFGSGDSIKSFIQVRFQGTVGFFIGPQYHTPNFFTSFFRSLWGTAAGPQVAIFGSSGALLTYMQHSKR